jgi:hypothetical protein
MLDRLDAQSCCDVRFTGAGAAQGHDIMRAIDKLAAMELAYPALRPAVIAIIDGLCRAIFGRNIPPAAADPQNMQDAGNDPAIINTRLPRLAVWQMLFQRFSGIIGQPK